MNMTDQERFKEMMSKIRVTFPTWGFTVGIVEMDTDKIWGWSNMRDPSWVHEFLAKQEPTTIYKTENN